MVVVVVRKHAYERAPRQQRKRGLKHVCEGGGAGRRSPINEAKNKTKRNSAHTVYAQARRQEEEINLNAREKRYLKSTRSECNNCTNQCVNTDTRNWRAREEQINSACVALSCAFGCVCSRHDEAKTLGLPQLRFLFYLPSF